MRKQKPAWLCFMAAILLLAACGKRDKLPSGILPKDQMALVMTDLQLLEASLSVKRLIGTEAALYYQDQYALILKTHKLTKPEFEKSFDYYTAHPKQFEPVYKLILEELSKKEAEVVNAKK